jgi:hypothetical protein
VHYWFSAVVRLSVRSSVRLFSPFLHLEGWNFEYKLRTMCMYLTLTGITWVPLPQIKHMRACLFFRGTLPWSATHVGYSLIRPKSQIPKIRHDGTLSIGNFMLMMKKPKNLEFEPLHPINVQGISCLSSITWVPAVQIGHERARPKGLSMRNVLIFELMATCASGLLPNSAKF